MRRRGQQDDARLVELSSQLGRLAIELDHAARHAAPDDDAEVQRLYRQGARLFQEISAAEATTIGGVQAKARALFWLHGEDRHLWDCRFSFDVINNVLALGNRAAPARRRPRSMAQEPSKVARAP